MPPTVALQPNQSIVLFTHLQKLNMSPSLQPKLHDNQWFETRIENYANLQWTIKKIAGTFNTQLTQTSIAVYNIARHESYIMSPDFAHINLFRWRPHIQTASTKYILLSNKK
jgi:hypothetical protein